LIVYRVVSILALSTTTAGLQAINHIRTKDGSGMHILVDI